MRNFFVRSGSRSRWAAGALATLAVTAAGCGGGGGTGSGGGNTTGTGGGGTTAIACTGQPSNLSLSGTWAAYGNLSVKLQGMTGGAITICPADQTGSASLALLITVKQDTADPTKLDQMQATLCSINLPTVTALVGNCGPSPTNLVSTQVIAPPAFLAALPKVASAASTGTLSAATPGSNVMVNPFDVVVGSSKMGSMLPSWNTAGTGCNMMGIGSSMTCDTTCVTDCAGLRDDDMDGYPGVTVQVCGQTSMDVKQGLKCNASTPSTPGVSLQGEAFIDIEVNPSFTGTVKSSCEVTGTVGSEVTYNVVGANVYLGPGQIPVNSAIESLPTFQVDPTASKFRMVRVDGQYGAPNLNIDTGNLTAACQIVNMNANQFD